MTMRMPGMNKFCIIVCLMFAFPACLFADGATFRINGTVAGSYNGSLVTLFTFVGNSIRSVDSTYVKDGHFSFAGPEYIYEESLVSVGNSPDTVLYADVYLKGEIDVHLKPKSVVRSSFNDEYKAFRDSTNVIYRKMFGVTDENLYRKLWSELWRFRFGFKKKHVHDGLGRELFIKDAMTYSGIELDIYAGDLYSLFSETDKNRDDIQKAYTVWNRSRGHAELIGSSFIDYNLIDKDGHPCRISDFIGKYDLLFIDFWATWCGPCIALDPTMKRMHEEYGGRGFGILALSLDTDRRSWLNYVNKDTREWANDVCILSPDEDKNIREAYKIGGIPFGILIDRNGKILHVLQHSGVIEYYLKSIYENN